MHVPSTPPNQILRDGHGGAPEAAHNCLAPGALLLAFGPHVRELGGQPPSPNEVICSIMKSKH